MPATAQFLRSTAAIAAPNARWASLMGGDLSYEGEGGGHPLWRFSDGDAVGIFFFSVKPDLPQTHEMTRYVSEFERRVQAGGARPVECSVLEVRGLPMVRTIVKVPQQPHGKTYLGSFTLKPQGIVTVRSTMRNQHGEAVYVLTVKLLVPRRPGDGNDGSL